MSRDRTASGHTTTDVPAEHRAQALRAVASHAHDADDCAMLLDMLGLNPAEARP